MHTTPQIRQGTMDGPPDLRYNPVTVAKHQFPARFKYGDTVRIAGHEFHGGKLGLISAEVPVSSGERQYRVIVNSDGVFTDRFGCVALHYQESELERLTGNRLIHT